MTGNGRNELFFFYCHDFVFESNTNKVKLDPYFVGLCIYIFHLDYVALVLIIYLDGRGYVSVFVVIVLLF